MTNKVSKTEYRIVLDEITDDADNGGCVMVLTNIEQAHKYRDELNGNTELTKKYGKVHIEKVVITTEVIK